MEAFSSDGLSGFSLRVARYPGQAIAWLWFFVFTPDGVYGFNDDTLPLNGFQGVTDMEAGGATYEIPGLTTFERTGARLGFRSVQLAGAVMGRHDAHPPRGAGDAPMQVMATFEPGHAPRSRVPNRMEAHGRARVRLTTPSGVIDLDAPAKYHEQHGNRPRFAHPFSYQALRNDRMAALGTRSLQREGTVVETGFIDREGETVAVRSIALDAPGPTRGLRFDLEDGSELAGVAESVHRFSVAIEDDRRHSSVVSFTTPFGTLTGLINEWQADRLPPAPTGR